MKKNSCKKIGDCVCVLTYIYILPQMKLDIYKVTNVAYYNAFDYIFFMPESEHLQIILSYKNTAFSNSSESRQHPSFLRSHPAPPVHILLVKI